MACQRCKADRVLSIQAWARDCHAFSMNGRDHDGYALPIEGICEGDATEFTVCLDCGQVQGDFPKPPVKELEEDEEPEPDPDAENYFDRQARLLP